MDTQTIRKEALKQILTEWHERPLTPQVLRDISPKVFADNQIVSVIGPRRAGKTRVCFQEMARLLSDGVPRENIIYVNFEDERLHPATGSELTELLPIHNELFPKNSACNTYCFLDEIQNIPNWSKWVRRVSDLDERIKIVITGSSSKLLSTEIATELRGRGVAITILPYSFSEFIRSREIPIDNVRTIEFGAIRPVLRRAFTDYLARGGFPEVSNRDDYRDILQSYYRAMFVRDILERFPIKNVRLFEDFLKIQISRFASLSSISSIAGDLTSLGHSLSKNTIVDYFSYACDAFVIAEVLRFDSKVTGQLRSPKKIYAVDHGLVNAIRFSTSEDRGRMLENAAYSELRKRGGEIFYHAEKTECDFIIQHENRITEAYQVAWSMEHPDTAKRELRGLCEAMQTYNLDSGIILTEDERGEIEVDGKKVCIMPLWVFALQG